MIIKFRRINTYQEEYGLQDHQATPNLIDPSHHHCALWIGRQVGRFWVVFCIIGIDLWTVRMEVQRMLFVVECPTWASILKFLMCGCRWYLCYIKCSGHITIRTLGSYRWPWSVGPNVSSALSSPTPGWCLASAVVANYPDDSNHNYNTDKVFPDSHFTRETSHPKVLGKTMSMCAKRHLVY